MSSRRPVIGILGGGQLGRMLCEAGIPINVSIIVLDAEDAPAKQDERIKSNSSRFNGSFKDPLKVRQLATECDVITVEIEHIDTAVLEDLEVNGARTSTGGKVAIQPSWETLRLIQDKYAQKKRLGELGIPVADQTIVESGQGMLDSMKQISNSLGFPWMLKARRDAYDGRGNIKISSEADLKQAAIDFTSRPCYAEKWVPFQMELAVVVIRTEDNNGNTLRVVPYPVVETIHEDSICSKVFMPPRNVSKGVCERAQRLACGVVKHLSGKGVFAVEMFLTEKEDLLVNEIAPRVHNSGHMTIETIPSMSQFKAHLTSILDRAVPEKLEPAVSSSIMINILGGAFPDSHDRLVEKAKSIYNKDLDVHVHLYGKKSKPSRKIGHITVTSSVDIEQLGKLVQPLIDIANEIRQERKQVAGRPQQSTNDPRNKPLVLVTMGSDSDLSVLKPGIDILRRFDVPYELDITSAHRTPQRMGEVAAKAASQGFKVIIAAAGGAAHLPGMMASHTTLPVIGVPVKASHLDGQDSLLSIVQMPKGVPVATVGINNSTNAALLATRILATSDEQLQKRMSDYQDQMKKEVEAKAERLKALGVDDYLDEMVKRTSDGQVSAAKRLRPSKQAAMTYTKEDIEAMAKRI
ncbi:MAG: hypothetical protein Q9169_002806 [Polycauliona sp. 2 TL-2023]